MEIEEYFPRGGANISEIQKQSFKDEDAHLSKIKKSNLLQTLNSRPVKKDYVTDINYGSIQEGMLILGCVSAISTMLIYIELPGRMSGRISITSVSNPLTKILDKNMKEDNINMDLPKLNGMFQIGQFIPTCVIKKELTVTGTKLILSTDPIHIHSKWNIANFTKGSHIWAAIELQLEHGYQLYVGITSCRVFLPSDKIEKSVKYVIGQPLHCIIIRSTIDSNLATLVVSALEKDVYKAVSSFNVNLCHLTPGCPINFRVKKVLENGLQGIFMKHKGYIFKSYLGMPFEDIIHTKYNNGDSFKVFLLYVEPKTKLAYFSSRGGKFNQQIEHQNGTLLVGQIRQSFAKGIYLNLPKNQVGFVSNKRLERNVENYMINSQQHCRILNFQHFEQLYICDISKDALIDNFITHTEIGKVVHGKIMNISPDGIVVNLGTQYGFISNIHLDNPKAKPELKIGEIIKAKVWSINENQIQLTTRSVFLQLNLCVKRLEDAIVNAQYPGIVVHKFSKGVLVIFYGNIKGILPKNHLVKIFGEHALNLFCEGEIVLTLVDKLIGENMFLKFHVPSPSKRIIRTLNVGDNVCGTVTKVCPNGIEVMVNAQKIQGFIPVTHLSSCLNLTPFLLNTYKVNDNIENLLCTCLKPIILSLREAKAFRKSNLQVIKLSELSVGSIVRCSFLKTFETRIRVTAPFLPQSEILYIYDDAFDKGEASNLKLQQAIVAKVTKFNPEKRIVKLTAKTEDIFKWNYDNALEYVEQYLEDVQRINAIVKLAISQYNIGKQVKCIIKAVDKFQCSVLLEGAVEGSSPKSHTPRNVRVSDIIEGVVIWTDFVQNHVYISFKEDWIVTVGADSANHLQENVSTKATIFTIFADFIVVVSEKKQIILVPILRRNYFLRYTPYEVSAQINVIIKRKVGNIFLGVDKSILTKLQHAKETYIKKCSPLQRKLLEVDNIYSKVEGEKVEDLSKYNFVTSNKVTKGVAKLSVALPGVNGFFDKDKVVPEISSDDNIEDVEGPVKKRKLNAAERVEVIQQAEERIRIKEIELANGAIEPENEEHFERLITGKPNSSELWAKYIAYCVSNAEIHKARNIAKAALKRIDLNETEERYNIWVTLLNLENNYGDKESFNKVFEEAVRSNDDLQTYLDVINLLASCEKYKEMDEKIKKAKSKFGQNLKMWISLARTYYKCGRLQDARKIQNSALRTIEKKTNHIDLIVQFAIMEFNHGENHHAEALFETILQSNPKRIDIWRVLERATAQTIPVKKMKILFKKYVDLEQRHGSAESVSRVVELVKEYVVDR
ncbi:hypothetical protein FQA39_LY15590 [Lamprigera yunnana]|nr:hypothetical protein FQA39_LY15590 [Lamprigera yunnana]